ncbi:MAG: hypothetical protein AAFR16_10875, partial [Pseudomonadota bacterium]
RHSDYGSDYRAATSDTAADRDRTKSVLGSARKSADGGRGKPQGTGSNLLLRGDHDPARDANDVIARRLRTGFDRLEARLRPPSG